MDTTTIFRDAPKYISQRFSAINSYVWQSFFPDNLLNERLRRYETEELSKSELNRLKDIANEASLVIFIFLLKRFFAEGTNAAIQAVDTFNELGVNGFQIGSKFFSGRNENVMEGQLLADTLMNTITNQELITLINDSQYVSQIVNRYRDIIEGNG